MEKEQPYHRIWNDIGAGMNSHMWSRTCEKCKYYNAEHKTNHKVFLCSKFNINNVNFRPKEYGLGGNVICYEAK